MSTRLLFALALATAPVSASASAPLQALPQPAVVDSAKLHAELQRAEKATYSGRAGEARAIYRKLIAETRAAGEYARLPLWSLAMHYLFQEDKRNAAATLDELARQANQFGDPTMELRATFESAVLWAKDKQHAYAAERIVRIKDLMKSPVIADADKAEFRKRMS
jgi:hypothetical protein